MAYGLCCAMTYQGLLNPLKQCSDPAVKPISTIGSDGASIERFVCNQHYKIANDDLNQGGYWGNRIRTEYCIWNSNREKPNKNPKKLSNKGFFGFLGESSFNSNHLIKTSAKYNPGDYIDKKTKTHRIKEFRIHHLDSNDTPIRYYTAEIVVVSNNIESNQQKYTDDELSHMLGNIPCK
jgi:hypothetical protein